MVYFNRADLPPKNLSQTAGNIKLKNSEEGAMGDIEGLSKEEIKSLILDEMRDLGINTETVEVEVVDGPKVILKGKVDSTSEKGMIKQTIMDVVGIDDISDELVVIEDTEEDFEEDFSKEEDEESVEEPLEEDEDIGTEDASQALEDGIPYIPPTSPTYQDSSSSIRRKRKKKKK